MAINLINPNFNIIGAEKAAGTSPSGSAGAAAGGGAGRDSSFFKALEAVVAKQQNSTIGENGAAGPITETAKPAGKTASSAIETAKPPIEKGNPADEAAGPAAVTFNLEQIFQKASDIYHVPVSLLKAVAKAESNFNPVARSSAGAQGIMQLMPATARSLGVTNAFDPEQNIMGGAKYLSQQLARYEGNTVLALAAYNAGPGNVAKYNGVPPFKETQNYISKVMGYAGETISAGSVAIAGPGVRAGLGQAASANQTGLAGQKSLVGQTSPASSAEGGSPSFYSADALLNTWLGLSGSALDSLDSKDYGLLMDLYRYQMHRAVLSTADSESEDDGLLGGFDGFRSFGSLV